MKKYFIILVLTVLASKTIRCQNVFLKYKVENIMMYTATDGFSKELATLNYEGYLFQKGKKTLYYEKPLYLNKYPDGAIQITSTENEIHSYGIFMDTMQNIVYRDADSLVFRNRIMMTPNGGINIAQKFEVGLQHWKILPDTAIISGLHCQKAYRNNKIGQLAWTVWFCTDMEVLAGPSGIYDLPGIVVEAEDHIALAKYSLVSFKTDGEIDESVFWPNVFNEPFKQSADFLSNKQEKLSDISNQ